MTVTQKDLDGVIKWIKDYFNKTGLKEAVVGLSGGIDSAVIASVCCRALEPKNVIGVVMPCYSQNIDKIFANKLATSIGIESFTTASDIDNVLHIDLEETFDTLEKLYRNSTGTADPLPMTYNKLVPANIKARL